MGADDFLVSTCNSIAVELVDAWPDWSQPVYMIEGPAGSGKTHLAHVWQHKTGASILGAGELSPAAIATFELDRGVILEDLDREKFDEQALFHLLNLARVQGFNVLLTSRVPPGRLDVYLPDLVSRLRALPVAKIGVADDALLSAVLLKHFSDRQLNVEPHVIKFLTRRMIRSMEAVYGLVAALDKAALASGKKITRQFAAEVLDQYQAGEN